MEALDGLVKFLGENTSQQSMFLVTMAEDIGNDATLIDQYLEDLKKRENLRKYIEHCKLAIKFIGSHKPSLKSKLERFLKQNNTMQANNYWNDSLSLVSQLREKFLDYLVSIKSAPLSTQCIQKIKEEIGKEFQRVLEEAKKIYVQECEEKARREQEEKQKQHKEERERRELEEKQNREREASENAKRERERAEKEKRDKELEQAERILEVKYGSKKQCKCQQHKFSFWESTSWKYEKEFTCNSCKKQFKVVIS